MTGEPGSPLRLLADELKNVIRRHELDLEEVQQALALVLADEIGKLALATVAAGGAAPSREAVRRDLAVVMRRFVDMVLTHADWALPDAEEDERPLGLDDMEKPDAT